AGSTPTERRTARIWAGGSRRRKGGRRGSANTPLAQVVTATAARITLIRTIPPPDVAHARESRIRTIHRDCGGAWADDLAGVMAGLVGRPRLQNSCYGRRLACITTKQPARVIGVASDRPWHRGSQRSRGFVPQETFVWSKFHDGIYSGRNRSFFRFGSCIDCKLRSCSL